VEEASDGKLIAHRLRNPDAQHVLDETKPGWRWEPMLLEMEDTDKGVWQHGRFAWLLATLHDQVEPRPEWLRLSRHGIDFLRAHGFDSDGRMFFHLTRDGAPVRKRRYLFSETFMIAALAAYGQAAGDAQAVQEAVDLFALTIRYLTTPGLIPPKVNPAVRPGKAPHPSIPAISYCQGTPLRNEIENRDGVGLQEATDAATATVAERFGAGAVDGKIQGHIVSIRA